VVDGNELAVVLENHDLVFGVSGRGIFPIIN
jgi:hypothetical protein